MKKLFYILFFLFLAYPTNVSAAGYIVSTSARLQDEYATESATYDSRAQILENYLESKNSPLAQHAKDFVKIADKYGLDWRLVPAISGVESTFGKNIPTNSYNAFGWANGNYYFQSWEEAIDKVTGTLRSRYIDRGADTVDKIAPIYAPPSTTWGWKVKYFMNDIDPLPIQFDL